MKGLDTGYVFPQPRPGADLVKHMAVQKLVPWPLSALCVLSKAYCCEGNIYYLMMQHLRHHGLAIWSLEAQGNWVTNSDDNSNLNKWMLWKNQCERCKDK